MQLQIDGILQTVTPIKLFRQQWQLPDDFSVSRFEPKDFTGLATIDRAGAEMNELRLALVEYARSNPGDLLVLVDTLQATFRAGLYGINERIGLKPVEVEYAIGGFGDVLRNWAYALTIATVRKQEKPPFMPVYNDWLYSTVRISSTEHIYLYGDDLWQIQIINHAYGRVGLFVRTPTDTQYVLDGIYACPAEGYMHALLQDLAAVIG